MESTDSTAGHVPEAEFGSAATAEEMVLDKDSGDRTGRASENLVQQLQDVLGNKPARCSFDADGASGEDQEAAAESSGLPEKVKNGVFKVIEYFYHFGKRITVAKDDKVYEFLIRPDVLEASLLSLVETILLTYHGTLSRKSAASSATLELGSVSITPGSSLKYFVRLYLNVSPQFQRVLIVHLGPETPTTAGAKLTSALRSDAASFPVFAESTVKQLEAALYGEGFSVPYLLDIIAHADNELLRLETQQKLLTDFGAVQRQTEPSASVKLKKKRAKKKKLNPFDESDSESEPEEAAKQQDKHHLSKSTPSGGLHFSIPMLLGDNGLRTESVVDPAFVRDLQLTYFHNMNRKLASEVDSTEKQLKTLELQCARLMTVLKPNYQLCCLTMPHAPVVKPLNDYQLSLHRPPIGEINDETTRLLIFRARKQARDIETASLSVVVDFTVDNSWISKLLYHGKRLHAIVLSIMIQLQEWEAEESSERLRRKMLQLRERIASVEEFKLLLISTLHYRNIRETTTADRNAIVSLQEKCRAITESEPLLIEMTAAHNGRGGTLYITLNHIFFYSYGGLFLSIFVKLFQIARLVKITSADPVSTLSSGSIILEDEGGGVSSVEVTGLTADYHSRIADFIIQLKQVNYFPRDQCVRVMCAECTDKSYGKVWTGQSTNLYSSFASAASCCTSCSKCRGCPHRPV
jgi:hypothetical protein